MAQIVLKENLTFIKEDLRAQDTHKRIKDHLAFRRNLLLITH